MSAKVNPDGDERDLQNRFYVRICAPEELEVICRSKHKSSVLAQLTSEGFSRGKDKIHRKFKLTHIYLFCALVSFLGIQWVWTSEKPSEPSFHILSLISLFNAFNTLGSRLPSILLVLTHSFDFWFSSINLILWATYQSIVFDFDIRCLTIWCVYTPLLWLSITTDATKSNFEFKYKKAIMILGCCIILPHLIFSEGNIHKHVSRYYMVVKMPNFTVTIDQRHINSTKALWAKYMNSSYQVPVRHERWKTETQYSLRNVANVRLLVYFLWLFKATCRALVNPEQCSVLTFPARKMIVTAEEITQKSSRLLDRGQPFRNLSKESVDDLARLEDDEEIEIYFPCESYTVEAGARGTIFFILTGDIDITKKVLEFCEKYHKIMNIFGVLSVTVVQIALILDMPHLAAFSILACPNLFRLTISLNFHVVKLLCKEFTLWFNISCLLIALILLIFLSIFLVMCFHCVIYFLTLIISLLFNDANLSHRRLQKGTSFATFVGICVMQLVYLFILSSGAAPGAFNVFMPYEFLENKDVLGTMTMINRCLLFAPLIYLLKFTVLSARNPKHCSLLRTGVLKVCCKKRDIQNYLEQMNKQTNDSSLVKTASRNE